MKVIDRTLLWLTVFAIAMACLESSVVAYLRELYYPGGFAFPIVIIPDRMTLIEVGREAATIVMLWAVSMVSGRDRWERFLHFCLIFGVWDIFYYVWLKLMLGWPDSLLTWDILFLIPVPWIGPVLAPVLISLAIIGGALWLLRLREDGAVLGFSWPLWALAVSGGIVVLVSFMIDWRVTIEGKEPPPFSWWIFLTGLAMGLAALVIGVRRLRPDSSGIPRSGDAP